MPIPEEALLTPEASDDLRVTIGNRLQTGKDFWRPLSVRQDYWYMLYLLQDVVQQMKPVGYRRFVSNEPRTAVDLAQSILTRNDVSWRIALNEVNDEGPEARAAIGKVERTIQGIIYDIDENFSERGLPRFWKQIAWQGLVRGWMWCKVHVTTEAMLYRESPLLAEVFDSRLVFPHFDAFGLNYVIIQRATTLGDLVNMYPDKYITREQDKDYNPNIPVIKIEYWSNDRGVRKGVHAVLAVEAPAMSASSYDMFTALNLGASEFIIEPFYHGYSPRELPIVGVPCNGIAAAAKPVLGDNLASRMQERAELVGMPNSLSWWQGNNAWVSETGRSLLSAVEEHIPQYNELVATIFQHLSISTYGNWVFTTPTGEIPAFDPGIESKIALTPEEKVQRLEVGPMNQDAYKLVQLLSDEKQNGTLANILRASSSPTSSGVLFQQQANAALNALEPYQDAMEELGQRVGTSVIGQIQRAATILDPWELTGGGRGGRNKSLFVLQFDPKTDLDPNRSYRLRPVFKPALPDDLAIRINAARLALDPRRPILSLVTVLENILQVDDPTAEIDRIWEDIANTDPIIVLEQVANALDKIGQPDIAKQMRDNEFQAHFLKEMQFRQQAGLPPLQPGQMPGVPQEYAQPDSGANGPGMDMTPPPTAPVGMQSQAGANPFSSVPMGPGNSMPGSVPEPWSDFKGELTSMGDRREV